MTDLSLLYLVAFVRSTTTGLMGVLLGIYLAQQGFSKASIGYALGAGMTGLFAAALLATLLGDRRGRRRMLVELTLLSAAGTLGVVASSQPLLVAAAAFVGMLNGMGRDRGAGLILDQAMLATISADTRRTRVMALYNVCQDAGHGFGALLAGLPTFLSWTTRFSPHATQRAGLLLYAALLVPVAIAYLRLSPAVEADSTDAKRPLSISPRSRRILARICGLFMIDALGGGFLSASLMSYFFFTQFGASPAAISLLFFAARAANAVSHLAAAWLAERIGLVNTMVFTHIPSSLVLALVPTAPSFLVAALLFLVRESLVEMDVPTRQSYVMAVVRPEERTFASGATNLVRLAGWAAAPLVAGLLMQHLSLAAPLWIGAGLKIAYDVALWLSFRALKPPEEKTAH